MNIVKELGVVDLMDRVAATEFYSPYGYDNTDWFSLDGWEGWARVVDVHDGDTITVIMSAAEGVHKFRIRLSGINAPEIDSKDAVVKQAAIDARNAVLAYVCSPMIQVEPKQAYSRSEIHAMLEKSVFLVWLECKDMDKYGRVLADVFPDKGSTSINDRLLESKLAVTFMV